MSEIEKALQDLTEALKRNESVEKITVTITLRKPKPSKAGSESK